MIIPLIAAAIALMLLGTLAWHLANRFHRASIADIFWPLHHLLRFDLVVAHTRKSHPRSDALSRC